MSGRRPFQPRTPIVLLSLGLLTTGCLSPWRESNPAAPTKDALDSDLPVHQSWTPHLNSSTYLLVRIHVNESQRVEFQTTWQAEWEHARAYLYYSELIEKAGFFVERARHSFTSDESCNTKSDGRLADCAPQAMSEASHDGQSTRLRPGTYVMLAAAYGASEATLRIDLLSEKGAAECSVQEGSARLGAVAYGPSYDNQTRGVANYLASGSFLATIMTKGGETTKYRLQDPAGRTRQLDAQLPTTVYPARFWYEGKEIEGVQFSGDEGNWTIESFARPGEKGPLVTHVATLENLPGSNDAGSELGLWLQAC
jgi:hypothetical protein